MPAPLDIALCVLLMVVWPVYVFYGEWPRFLRWLSRDPGRARIREFQSTVVQQWMLTAIAALIWLRVGRSWADIGLRPVDGWGLWVSAAVVLAVLIANMREARALAKNDRARTAARGSHSIRSLEPILPHNNSELLWFLALSVTAGVCEEFLFRGYLISALAPWLGWWPAAVAVLIPFGLGHAYQGRSGIVKTVIVGGVMTLVVAATHSLIPAMALHVVIDVGGGVVSWVILKGAAPVPVDV